MKGLLVMPDHRRLSPVARCLLAICFSLLTAHCLLPTVLGQGANASLSGTVVDTNGAVVPGATITIINVGTNLRRQTTTSDNGDFRVPLLPPATYTMRVERQG